MTFKSLVDSIVGALNTVIVPVIFALAFLAFIWGVLNNFILHPGDEKRRMTGRQFILWGLLGMVLLFSIWGVVNLLLSTLGLSSS